MRTSLDCLPCIVRQAVDSARMVTKDEKQILKMMQLVFQNLAEADLAMPPPEIGQEIYAIIRRELKNSDPFLKLKKMSTERALALAPEVKEKIISSDYPFATALAFAIAGNILDFGVRSDWNEAVISGSFHKAAQKAKMFDTGKIETLYSEIKNAKKILYLGDNAGETVFDRLFIEQFPGSAEIFYAVKSSPVINDATFTEAVEAGLHNVAKIITNGADIPGTVLRKCSPDFLSHYQSADIVISKGQGNFETLNEAERKIWFLFQVKCEVIAQHYGYSLGDWLLLESLASE
jgi:damage-control phosphatase, subfamily I